MSNPNQIIALEEYSYESIFTVGETVGDYTPAGILDGLGAYAYDADTVRVLANSELRESQGYEYTLDQGAADTDDDVTLTGARIQFFDINKETLELEGAGLAYNRIFDRAGELVRDADQLDDPNGLCRLCSAQLFDSHQFGDGRGVDDRLFITGEETGGGTAYVLDPASDALYAVAAFGKAGFESVTQLDTGTTDKVAFIIGDDRAGAPLLLYVGEKGAGDGPELLVSNGLMEGGLYVWVAKKKGVVDTSDFNGTGNQMTGKWVEIEYYNPDSAGEEGYDALGYGTQDKQDELAEAAGAFEFSRPEDVHTNPADGSEFVLASTGKSLIADDSDLWGTTYTMDVKFNGKGEPVMGTAKILYDGDDAGAGQFDSPDAGLRSPDNLTWADDGLIYVQQDRSVSGFGDDSGVEASIWTLDPVTGELTRVAQVNRDADLPGGQSDSKPGDIGNWETSGIIDVSELFGFGAGELLLMDVQAHSVRNGSIGGDPNLVQGGQLGFLAAPGVEI